jgi:hypothetical protein
MLNGAVYIIQRPNMAMLTGSALLVGVGKFEGEVPGDFDICPISQIATVEATTFDSPPPAP